RPARECGGTVDARRLKLGCPTDVWVRLPPPLPSQFLCSGYLFSLGSSPRGATLWRGISENNHLAIPAYNGVQQGFDGTESRTRSGPGAGFDSPVLHLLFPVYRSVRRRAKERHPIPDQTRRTPTDSPGGGLVVSVIGSRSEGRKVRLIWENVIWKIRMDADVGVERARPHFEEP